MTELCIDGKLREAPALGDRKETIRIISNPVTLLFFREGEGRCRFKYEGNCSYKKLPNGFRITVEGYLTLEKKNGELYFDSIPIKDYKVKSHYQGFYH